jgi:hypothetical protein
MTVRACNLFCVGVSLNRDHVVIATQNGAQNADFLSVGVGTGEAIEQRGLVLGGDPRDSSFETGNIESCAMNSPTLNVLPRLTPRCNRSSFRIQFGRLNNWRWGFKSAISWKQEFYGWEAREYVNGFLGLAWTYE